ncbi:hypothetical protein CTI12_AA573300 [Artemisia annua]|uniref:NAC domain-containing protein n=1 Tax=Artemisia annua TaxID=35608 RepID=A0A2U1KRE5_ARTAN|nr:hypothetical protein CTI12_AA573300 [Artemisia annua]
MAPHPKQTPPPSPIHSTLKHSLQIPPPMAATSPPLGYQFDPEDYELINVLNHKLQNKPIPFDQTTHLDLYSNHPWVLLKDTQPAIKRTKEHVIYTPRYRATGSTHITRRVLGGRVGIWKQVSNFGYVVKIDGSDGNVVGREMRFVFYEGDVNVGLVRKTDWYMTEFTNMDGDDDEFSICKLKFVAYRV